MRKSNKKLVLLLDVHAPMAPLDVLFNFAGHATAARFLCSFKKNIDLLFATRIYQALLETMLLSYIKMSVVSIHHTDNI